MDLLKTKKLVIKAGKELVKKGLIARTWGNVSCRISEKKFVITPSGRSYLELTPEEIVTVDIDTLYYEGNIKPSSEKGVHAKVYESRSDINFIIHTHQENASVIGACEIDHFKADNCYTTLKGEVKVAKYALPGTKKLSYNISKTLEISKGAAIILKNHGAICYGKDYEKTFKTAIELEKACWAFLEHVYMMKAKVSESSEDKLYRYILNQNNREYCEPLHNNKFVDSLLNILQKKNLYIEIERSQHCMVAASLGQTIRPLLDDFAQIIGLKVKAVSQNANEIQKILKKNCVVLVEGVGAICIGDSETDVKAMKIIVSKNCKAHLCSLLVGKPRPINIFESKLMNYIYKKKYSKQIKK